MRALLQALYLEMWEITIKNSNIDTQDEQDSFLILNILSINV